MLSHEILETSLLDLYMNSISAATKRQALTHIFAVTDVKPLSKHTFQVELQLPAGTTLDYHPGQYLQLELNLNSDGQPQSLFYSIANSFHPEQPGRLQLFVDNSSELTDKVLKHLHELKSKGTRVKVTLPMGYAYLQTDLDLPHLLIAAGSGISKIKCIAEEILNRKPNADMRIYWSNKNTKEFYLLDEFLSWTSQYEKLEFMPIIESADANWLGRSGYIYEVIEEDFENFDGAQVYLCGSPQMVYGTIDKLKSSGLKEENCYSDVFEYAPRDQIKKSKAV